MTDKQLVKPFLELVERAMDDMGERSTSSTNRKKVFMARCNEVYQNILPSRYEFPFLRRKENITLVADYSTGTVAVDDGSTTVTGTDTTWTSAMTGRKIKFGSRGEVYTFTYVSATSGTIDRNFIGDDQTADTYSIYEDTYQVADDYANPVTEPNLYYEEGNGIYAVEHLGEEEFRRRYTNQPSQRALFWKIAPELTSDGKTQIQITPPSSIDAYLAHEYEYTPEAMTAYEPATSVAVASTTAGSTTVTTDNDVSAFMSAGQWFRVDSDGTWRQISSISTTTITLVNAYPTTNSSVEFSVSDAPAMPPFAHMAIQYGICMLTAKSQETPEDWAGMFELAVANVIAKYQRHRFGRRKQKRFGVRR